MNDRPQLLKPNRQSLGHSPTRHKIVADDILGHLTPASAMEALLAPSGAIKGCMDIASPAEKEFAMRTAIASQRICEWLDELRDWTWAAEGGDSGFQQGQHTETRRKLFAKESEPESSPQSREYMGSLLARDVARYVWRIEEIQRDMNELEVEDIKAHILTHHILPLSRPGTPMSDGSKSYSSMSAYTRMGDLSAIVTAIVIQALPNLAKLMHLMHVWTMRLAVLPQIPSLLNWIHDAETNLESGWNAVMALSEELLQFSEANGQIKWEPSLTTESFTVMKKALTRKIAKPGRTLDYMLDCLEGLDDTLPDDWLDRMEAVEQSYGDWVAVGERKIREAEWSKNLNRTEAAKAKKDASISAGRASLDDITTAANNAQRILLQQEDDSVAKSSFGMVDALGIHHLPGTPGKPLLQRLASSDDNDDEDNIFDGTMSPVKEEEEEEEPDLPPFLNTRRLDSDDLMNETVLYGASSQFDAISSDMPEVSGSPTILKGPIRTLQGLDNSPPSSPPLPGHINVDSSMLLLDSPSFSSAPEYDDTVFTKSPDDGSFTEDFDDSYSVSDVSSPKFRRESVGDQQLRQQISQIISSIPAKIKLSSEPPKEINLNPPDLQLPRLKKKSSKEPFRRNTSGLSSRTATPSFTLSPAKSTRPRHQRGQGQQEIKVYHLSRSTGEAPIKLFIRCVGENGERVMVRVGGGWADLSEYLKEYATHHGRRSGRADETTVEIRDLPRSGLVRASKEPGSTPTSRPGSAAAEVSPSTPLKVRKIRKGMSGLGNDIPRLQPKTPATLITRPSEDAPGSGESTRSRSSSHDGWKEENSSFLGLAGPSAKRVEMSEESKAWVETVREKVRIASGERKIPPPEEKNRFGDLGKVGGTKRLFRRAGDAKR